MRVAAGVLFCIMAAVNIFAGIGWATGGGLLAGSGMMADEMAEEAAAENPDVSASDVEDGSNMAKAGGGLLVVYGVFLLVLAGLEIAGGVFLFKAQKAIFVGVVAGLEALADIGAMAVLGSFLFGLLGLVTAALAGVAAYQLRGEEQQAAG